MSHEIRTPMTAILGFSELIVNDNQLSMDPEEAERSLGIIRRNANHLLTLINDILDLSKIESGKLQIEIIDVDLHDVLHNIERTFQSRCDSKNIQLRIVCKPGTPQHVRTDPTRLQQILVNLVGNAVKFTEGGVIEVRAEFDKDKEVLTINVDDSGIGLSDAQLEKLLRFEPFAQADTSTTRKFGGTGLGLRISQMLANLLGGEINVASQLGVGSQFEVTLSAPVSIGVTSRTPEAKQPSPATGNLSSSLDGIKLLIAEDGIDNQKLLTAILKKAGAEFEIVENGELAIEAYASSENLDLILLDMQMPVMDGFTAARKLRELGVDLPIVALTANAMASDRAKCNEAGCSDFISKPFDRHELIAQIYRIARPESAEQLA